ncbi:hypothetical protein BFS30_25050 [Pedobacter steynii]|uniref:Uncharacterized protein n=1 Tax=Pedobacter steynii TaxID=430522 RepID=A0A1D7QNC7_9SPHI|nr:hypothetical protein BFS30_25050 [Pedobacter steynii]
MSYYTFISKLFLSFFTKLPILKKSAAAKTIVKAGRRTFKQNNSDYFAAITTPRIQRLFIKALRKYLKFAFLFY